MWTSGKKTASCRAGPGRNWVTEMAWRDIRITCILVGSNEIMKQIIARVITK
jgi:alkylation response protein AidB-like acyl-CoA dehydrogenase